MGLVLHLLLGSSGAQAAAHTRSAMGLTGSWFYNMANEARF
jgi:hypothetical protein